METRACRSSTHLQLLDALRDSLRRVAAAVSSTHKETVPWFPRHLKDLDGCNLLITKFDPHVDHKHPGYDDSAYRQRRRNIAELAFRHKQFDPLPIVEYTEEEVSTWRSVYQQLRGVYPSVACRQFLDGLQLLERECGYNQETIPQLREVSALLKGKTGFQLLPVAGLLSSRHFLSCLALRVFPCTQFVRHASGLVHSPEPDCLHELLGHVPMLAEPHFAHFSQELGLASLGASDEDIERLSTLYWFTLEFGLCRQDGALKAYGAALLSSYGELMHALSGRPQYQTFDPERTARQPYQDQSYQPVYFVSESLEDAEDKLRKYLAGIRRPFAVRYDDATCSVEVTERPGRIRTALRRARDDLKKLHGALKRLRPLKEAEESQRRP